MNKNNFLSFPRQDEKNSKEMLSLLNYQKVFFKEFWDSIKVGDVDLRKGDYNE